MLTWQTWPYVAHSLDLLGGLGQEVFLAESGFHGACSCNIIVLAFSHESKFFGGIDRYPILQLNHGLGVQI